MKQSQRTNWLGCAILTGLALACSGESSSDELELAAPSDVSREPSGTDSLLDMEALLHAEVTSDEMLVLEDFFTRSSLGAPTSTEGRLLHWEDAMMTVDDALFFAARMAERASIEKGYAAASLAFPVDSNSIEFFRPDIGLLYYVIVANNLNTNVFNAVRDVALEWTGLSVDCLGQGTFQVITQADYNDNSKVTQNQRDTSYEINFQYSASPSCQSGQTGCMAFPARQDIKVNGSFVRRVALGATMSINSTIHPSSDIPGLKKVLRHEFGHGFGFQHQQVNATHIVGTTICGIGCDGFIDFYPSVMRSGGDGGVFILPEDDRSLRTLYANVANRPNDDCQYVNDFRVLTKLP